MRKNSVKNNRINGEVMRQLGMIIRNDIKDPRISPMTSVVAVNVTPDLKFCKAYISVLGSEEELSDTIAGLKSARIVDSIRQKLFSLPEDTVCYPGHNDETSIAFEKVYNPYLD